MQIARAEPPDTVPARSIPAAHTAPDIQQGMQSPPPASRVARYSGLLVVLHPAARPPIVSAAPVQLFAAASLQPDSCAKSSSTSFRSAPSAWQPRHRLPPV